MKIRSSSVRPSIRAQERNLSRNANPSQTSSSRQSRTIIPSFLIIHVSGHNVFLTHSLRVHDEVKESRNRGSEREYMRLVCIMVRCVCGTVPDLESRKVANSVGHAFNREAMTGDVHDGNTRDLTNTALEITITSSNNVAL